MYFGKTTQDPNKYLGSGKHWVAHIKKYGKKQKHIATLWYELFTDVNLIQEFALSFSIDMNIVESKQWANLKYENGIDGGDTMSGKTHTLEAREKQRMAATGKIRGPHSQETRDKMSLISKGKPKSQKTKENMRGPRKKVTCPHCNLEGGGGNMPRYHFDNCKHRK